MEYKRDALFAADLIFTCYTLSYPLGPFTSRKSIPDTLPTGISAPPLTVDGNKHSPQWVHSTTVPDLSWPFGTRQIQVDPW